ncbi:GNAT family N-acetyltransferase [Lentzea nigeriaca]|uniref:GNAT family N-acetyltransferase n=1 Tax=Lentzea nigeriaca TaxID=1128665 RepID=UPI00195937C8|nr:GNAT family protein [Lentzea nigeriaca]MBM7859501.1 RimJ/RimL family protein N-acetyltransferase [Lentzea nigeriaca]
MEPVEINAGEYYLRAFRNDDRISDVQALVEIYSDEETKRYMNRMGIDDALSAQTFIMLMTNGWERNYRWSWAVCDAVTADMVAGVVLHNLDQFVGSAEVSCWTHAAHRGKGVLPIALNAVMGWAFGAAGMHRIVYKHSVFNKASQRIPEKCGFTLEGRLRGSLIIDDQRVDELLWSRLATDPQPDRLR